MTNFSPIITDPLLFFSVALMGAGIYGVSFTLVDVLSKGGNPFLTKDGTIGAIGVSLVCFIAAIICGVL